MPEIKNSFTQGKMNKDLDERLIPNGQYRDAMNIQVSTSDGSDIGTVQNILGNTLINSTPGDSVVVGGGWECVGSIVDEKNDVLYSFVAHTGTNRSAILEYAKNGAIEPVLVDIENNTLKFSQGDMITGINIIDGFLLWTDGTNEPKKINIERCKAGTNSFTESTKLVIDGQVVAFRVQTAWTTNYTNTSGGTTTLYLTGIGTASNPEISRGDKLTEFFTTGGLQYFPTNRFVVDVNYTTGEVTVNTAIYNGLGTAATGNFVYFDSYKPLAEEYITVIKKKPLKPLSVKMIPANLGTATPLFEKIFPRFSYRYRYVDGEYSASAPYTDVVFNSLYPENLEGIGYNEKTAYGTKEPYNTGMRNMIESIELYDFVSPNMPKDVVQVDLLYKQENSSVVYVMEVIKNTDAQWNEHGINGSTSKYKGKFAVKSENIYAALPTNQSLRPWDNVPKVAKAQEITGNRLVYGNYKQGYNIDTSPKIVSNHQLRYPTLTPPYPEGGLRSVKSQRNYQLGVVYGDKYGRETPVFTSSESSVVIPWEDNASLTSGGVNHPLASFSLQLKTHLESTHPSWADYYKFFVKETSGEYYNLVMDTMWTVTKPDLETDEHIWLSFASSDRNKISKDDYIILKKRVTDSTQVETENKFRVLDVQNEAPDAIKYLYNNLGERSNTIPTAVGEGRLMDLFDSSSYTIMNVSGSSTSLNIMIDKTEWLSFKGGLLMHDNKPLPNPLYLSWTKVINAGNSQHSKKYKVVSIRESGTGANAKYSLKLEKKISAADQAMAESDTFADTIDAGLVFRIEQKISRDLESFSGRFFVKILANSLTRDVLLDITGSTLNQQSNTTVTTGGEGDVFYLANKKETSYIESNGLINNSGKGNTAKNVADDITTTEAAWSTILSSMSGTSNFFIDRMHMAAVQTGLYAKHATYGLNAGSPNDIGDTFGHGGGSNSSWPPLPGSSYKQYGSGSFLQMWYPANNEIKPQNPTSDPAFSFNYGDQLVNGLEGIVTTNSDHVNAGGLRRWRDIAWGDGYSLWNWDTSSTLNTTVYNSSGQTYLHISYLAPGEDLHNGTFKFTNSNLRTMSSTYSNQEGDELLHNSLQGIHGGGVFTSAATTYTGSNYNGNKKDVYMEMLPIYGWVPVTTGNPHNTPTSIGGSAGGGSFQNKNGGFDRAYRARHDAQWDLPQADKDFIEQFTAGVRFRFTGDTTIYQVADSNVTQPRKLYNHTPWRKMWKKQGSGVVGMGNSVEEAAADWADSTDGDGANGDSGKIDILKERIENFGKANNRRVSYIIMIDADPTAGGTTYDPLTNITATSENGIQIVTEVYDSSTSGFISGTIAEFPAIWETEPKDNVDLDIYYEASQAYPITLTEQNAELFAPIGCRVSILGEPTEFAAIPDPNVNYPTTSIDGTAENYIESWRGTEITLDNNYAGFQHEDDNSNSLSYHGLSIRFTREDGSYTTGRIVGFEGVVPETGGGGYYNFKIEVHPNAHCGLGWYNCFSFGNGIESDRIRDDFNAMTITNGVNANSTLDKPYTEEHRKNGLIYSGIYNSTSGINNLNQFIAAEKITKDLNPTYGSIQKLFQRRISLIAFCEDRVVGITSNKNALYNADGDSQLVASNTVLGDANPFVGDYGISKNPESFAKDSYRAYFADKQRGAVLRLSMDGLTPISDAGMSDWFKDEFKGDHYNIIGSFDTYKDNYNLTFDDSSQSYPGSKTVTYSEDVKGWVSFKSFIQESGASMSGDYYTFRFGQCWKHHNNPARNVFYNQQTVPSTVKFIFNESPTAIKNFNTINYDGDEGWLCNSIVTNQQSGTVTDFIEKEGKWFNYIKGNNALDTGEFNFQGIGTNYNIIYNN